MYCEWEIALCQLVILGQCKGEDIFTELVTDDIIIYCYCGGVAQAKSVSTVYVYALYCLRSISVADGQCRAVK
jgi:hypothetical protein